MTKDILKIQRFCADHKNRLLLNRFAQQGSFFAAIILFVLASIQTVFAMFPWTVLVLVWDTTLIAFFASIFFILFDGIVRNPISLNDAAKALEKSSAIPHQTLTVALELSKIANNHSSLLLPMVFENTARSIASYPAPMKVFVPLHKLILLLVSLLFFSAATFMGSPKCMLYWKLPFSYFQTISTTVFPGTIHMPWGQACTLRCTVAGNKFPSGALFMNTFGTKITTVKVLTPDSLGNFSTFLDSVPESFAYSFTIGSKQTRIDTVFVAQRPILSGFLVKLVPPVYTGLKTAILPDGQGNFSAYPGTRAYFQLESTNPLLLAHCIIGTRDSLPCRVFGKVALCEMTVTNRSSYTVSLTDTFGQKSDSLPVFSIDIINDLAPSIFFVKPHANKTCDPTAAETLMVEALDDIGLTSVSLFARKNHDSSMIYANEKMSRSNGLQKALSLQILFDLRRFSLYPNDTVFYWAIACDNRAYGAPQRTATDTFFFRVPSFEEIHEQIANEQNATEQTMRSVRKKQDDMQKSVSSLLQSTKNKQSLSWEQKQIAKDLQNAVNGQADSLQKALDSFKEAVEKIKQQQSMPQELLKKMEQIQQELDALRKQFGDSLFLAKSKAEDDISMQDLKKSLEQFKTMLPELSQRLDNALKFIAMLKRDQELAKLANTARELARQQHDIAAMEQNSPQCTAKQKEQNNEVNSLLSQIDQRSEQPMDSALFNRKDLPSLPKVQSRQNAIRFQTAKSQMPSVPNQEEMSASLSSLSEDLMNLQSSAMSKKMDTDRKMLLSMAHDALSLSDWQHIIYENVNEPNSQAGDISINQAAVKTSLQNSKGKLDSLAMTPPQSMFFISKAYDKCISDVDANLGFLSSSNAPFISLEPQASMNELAKTIFDALASMGNNQAGQSSGASSMMQGMRKLSQKQASLNSLTGDLLQRMLGKGSSPGESGDPQLSKDGKAGNDAARSEAQAQQKEIADALKKLADQYGKNAGQYLDSKAKDLEQEARRLAKQFDSPSPDLIDNQDKFLSRMLETTLSQHKQDEGREERVSTSAKNIFSQSATVSPSDANRGADSFYRMRQKAFMGNFPESYRLSVKNYFDSLGVLYLK